MVMVSRSKANENAEYFPHDRNIGKLVTWISTYRRPNQLSLSSAASSPPPLHPSPPSLFARHTYRADRPPYAREGWQNRPFCLQTQRSPPWWVEATTHGRL